MRSVPGHNKYDLYYSIAGNQPTYIQGWHWWDDDVKPYVLENYEFVPTTIDTPFSRNFLLLRKGNPFVRWELIHSRSVLSRSASLPPGGHSG